jgi:type IV pilus assembly protein PilA
MLKSMLTHMRETSMREFEGDEGAEAGFTLIELMVVLLIIAILLAIAIPTFLGVANSAGDRAAQSNLTNALTEAKAIYQNAATYSPSGTAITAATFSASAPEFSWVSGATACTATNTNCISEQVVDAGANTDGNGIILAAYSNKTSSCWYAVDLESAPVALTSDTGVPFINGTTDVPTSSAGTWTAGVFYAKKASTTLANCTGNFAATSTHFAWGLSYASPGAAQ